MAVVMEGRCEECGGRVILHDDGELERVHSQMCSRNYWNTPIPAPGES